MLNSYSCTTSSKRGHIYSNLECRSLATKGVIKLGWHTDCFDKKLSKRLCPLCSQSLDDEYHVLLICDRIKNIRRSILPNSMTIDRTREQFRNILSKADITLYAIA